MAHWLQATKSWASVCIRSVLIMEFHLWSCLELELCFGSSDSAHGYKTSFAFSWNMFSVNRSNPIIMWRILMSIQEINKSHSSQSARQLRVPWQVTAANLCPMAQSPPLTLRSGNTCWVKKRPGMALTVVPRAPEWERSTGSSRLSREAGF